jgi:isopentenyl-diphosphate delta-isomerase
MSSREQHLPHEEWVVLVDEEDRELGVEEKLASHRNGGRLHRAFSVFIFDRRGEMLLQRRSDAKYHFRGKWTNACCGHPRPGEAVEAAAQRRLKEELGFETALVRLFSFRYRAEDPDSGLVEHELDHVLVGTFDGTPRPDPNEVSEVRWAARADLERDLAARPASYSSWFPEALARLLALEAWPASPAR